MSLRPSFLLLVVALLSLLLVGSYAAGQESTRVAEILSVFVSSLVRFVAEGNGDLSPVISSAIGG